MLEDGCLMESLTKLSQYVHENADKLRSAARSHGKATLIELLALSVPTKKREGNKTEAQWYKWLSRHRSSFKEEENNLLRNLDNSLGFATVTLQPQLRDFEAFLRENKAKLKKTQGSSLLSLLPKDDSWPEGRSWRNWLARNQGHLMKSHGTQLKAIQEEHGLVDKTLQMQLCDFEDFLRENKAKLKSSRGSNLLSLLPKYGSWPEGRSWHNWLARNHEDLVASHAKRLQAIQAEFMAREPGNVHKLHDAECPLPDDLPRSRLPKCLRQLYGNSSEAEYRIMPFFNRVNEIDSFLLDQHTFSACDYCKEGWFGTVLPKQKMPGGFETETFKKMNFVVVPLHQRLQRDRSICVSCYKEAQDRQKQGLVPEPVRLTDENWMDPGASLPETDALTFFEEEIMSPIQSIIRIFTLYSTGQCELRGHVGNMHQDGPQYVRQIPALVGDMKMLLIRRCPKNPQRKQRVPFLVSRRRLQRALDRMARPAAAGGSLALQPGALTPEGYVGLVCQDNLLQYSDTEHGEEPEGLEVSVVEQEEILSLDFNLFKIWLAVSHEFQLNLQVRHKHEPADVADPVEQVAQTWNSFRNAVRRFGVEETEGASEEGAPCAARSKSLALEHVVQYLEAFCKVTGEFSLENVLKDELTAAMELAAWESPMVASGFWSPEEVANQTTEADMMNDMWSSLEEVQTADAKTKRSVAKHAAGRVPGLPILDPPTVKSRNVLIREDQPFYIVARFCKLFPTGKADYWAFDKNRRQQNMPVSFWEWMRHQLLLSDGRAQKHPIFYFFLLNTALRNKSLRSRSYFVKQQCGETANTPYTADQLFKMGKKEFTRIIGAFEHSQAGSAQEKLQQRSDLEAMCEQIQQESHENAWTDLQEAYRQCNTHATAATEDAHSPLSSSLTAVRRVCSAEEMNTHSESKDAGQTASQHTSAEDLAGKLLGCLNIWQQGGDIPCHFTTLTTAIYQWQDLAQILETYERQTLARRGGRNDPLEPSEARLDPHMRRVLQYPGVVAWFTCYKLELFYMHVMQYVDKFGIFEWGAGGIHHMHSANWGKHMPRYIPGKHEISSIGDMEQAASFAKVHEEYITEWNINKAEKWTFSCVDNNRARWSRTGQFGEPRLGCPQMRLLGFET